ncbi:MAG TPA: metalloregulator ArsR/SmtB family transcription factor [Candidatus Limnocylindria bacterium]|nr:metalloregulator ArsR/SmtB family transcription factor [Candidatus Limnocylindria bacterium]
MPTSKPRRTANLCELTAVFDAGLLAALCEPARVDILRVLVAHGRADLQTIAAELPQDRSVISRHLAVLHRAGVVRREKVGRQVFFELDGPNLLDRLDGMVAGCRRLVATCCPPTPKKGARHEHAKR